MPFKSQAQRRFMYSQHPGIAKEFESKTPNGAHLPERVSPFLSAAKKKVAKGGRKKSSGKKSSGHGAKC